MLDSREKQLFAMMGSSNAQERATALEKLYALLERTKRSFAGVLKEFEELEAANRKLEAANKRLHAANAAFRKAYLSLEALRKFAGKLRFWLYVHGGQLMSHTIGWGIVAGIAFTIWHFYGPGTGPAAVAQRAALEKDMQGLARQAAQSPQWSEGESEPRVFRLSGDLYWIVAVNYSENSGYSDALNHRVAMHCAKIFAQRAVESFGAYVEPSSRGGLGWFAWDERAHDCKVSATQQAEK